jgi:hypothetical protein
MLLHLHTFRRLAPTLTCSRCSTNVSDSITAITRAVHVDDRGHGANRRDQGRQTLPLYLVHPCLMCNVHAHSDAQWGRRKTLLVALCPSFPFILSTSSWRSCTIGLNSCSVNCILMLEQRTDDLVEDLGQPRSINKRETMEENDDS